MPNYKTIGTRLIALREKNGLSRSDMARKIGIPYVTLYSYETGSRLPSKEMMLILANELGSNVQSIFFTD